MKKFIQKFCVGIAMLCLSFSASAYDFGVDGICYDIIDLAELTCGVSGTAESLDCTKEIVLPSQVSFLGKTLTVIKIMDYAFKGTNIVNISLPKTCTSIGGYAFSFCDKLQFINIPDGVTSIGYDAFASCSALTQITLPENLTSIKDYAFSDCSLTHINIPDGVTSIGMGVFMGCSSLTQINIPNGVTSIGWCAFCNCSSLSQINIPDGVTSIKYRAFYNCSSLTQINIPDAVTSIGDRAFAESIITSFCISDSNQKLNLNLSVFSNSKIKDLYIGRDLYNKSSYQSIFENASIDSLTIGSRVTKLGKNIFTGSSTDNIYGVKNVQKINILPSEEILECEDLSLLRVNPDVLILGRKLSGSSIFSNATNVKHLEIGENVNDISNLSLGNNNITTMLVKTAIPPKCITVTFSKNTYLYCSLKVPVGALDAYKSADGWKNFWNIEECDFSGVEAIEGDKALSCVADNGTLRIENKNGNSIVRVYNIQGAMVAETSDDVVNNLPDGLYIVTVENKSFKVSLR